MHLCPYREIWDHWMRPEGVAHRLQIWLADTKSNMAQRKRAGLITRRSPDRNGVLLFFFHGVLTPVKALQTFTCRYLVNGRSRGWHTSFWCSHVPSSRAMFITSSGISNSQPAKPLQDS